MTTELSIISLASGQTIALAEYGARDGEPIFFSHGWPSSRTMAELTHTAARELNLRIISPDRPGIRNSSLHPKRKLLDWPPLLEELADRLGIEQFRMLGISGGTPYAFASAWAMAERVRIRHRLVVDVLCALGVPTESAEADAEGIEHHVSETTLKAFALFLKSRR